MFIYKMIIINLGQTIELGISLHLYDLGLNKLHLVLMKMLSNSYLDEIQQFFL